MAAGSGGVGVRLGHEGHGATKLTKDERLECKLPAERTDAALPTQIPNEDTRRRESADLIGHFFQALLVSAACDGQDTDRLTLRCKRHQAKKTIDGRRDSGG